MVDRGEDKGVRPPKILKYRDSMMLPDSFEMGKILKNFILCDYREV